METEVKVEFELEEKDDLADWKIEPFNFDSEEPEIDQKLDVFKCDPCDKARIRNLRVTGFIN